MYFCCRRNLDQRTTFVLLDHPPCVTGLFKWVLVELLGVFDGLNVPRGFPHQLSLGNTLTVPALMDVKMLVSIIETL
jgi:hypothetical protein